jgi:hypothetical protein
MKIDLNKLDEIVCDGAASSDDTSSVESINAPPAPDRPSPAAEPAEAEGMLDVRCTPEYLAARAREEERRMLEQQQIAQHDELMVETAVRLDRRAGLAPDSVTANQQRARELIEFCRGLGFTMRLDGGEVVIDFNGRGYTRSLVRELQMYAAEITTLVSTGWGIH